MKKEKYKLPEYLQKQKYLGQGSYGQVIQCKLDPKKTPSYYFNIPFDSIN